ncbi:hypothetical protein [Rossellomorea marisflavi]|uniref:hypothetical protein n=1 Tax=Rossellomorea marisflavi TaxID=189381 RepID=UPI00345DBCDA
MNELVKLGVDLYKKQVQDYSQAQGNDVMRKAFIEILGTDKPDYRQFRKHKVEVFEIIEEVLAQTITDGMATPFFDQFVEYRDLDLGDSNEFYVEDRTMLTVARHSGNHWNIRRQKLNIGDTFTVQTEAMSAAVYADFKRFLAGRIDWDQFVAKVGQAFVQELNDRIHVEFMNTINYLPAEFKETGSFSEESLRTIVEHVQAANQGSPVVIAGTKSALAKLSKVETLSDGMKDQLNRSGLLQAWEGNALLPIPQSHKPNTFEFAIDNDRLLVLPANAKPIKVVKEGMPLVKEVSDGLANQDMSMEYKFIAQYGVATVFNLLFGQYKFSG